MKTPADHPIRALRLREAHRREGLCSDLDELIQPERAGLFHAFDEKQQVDWQLNPARPPSCIMMAEQEEEGEEVAEVEEEEKLEELGEQTQEESTRQ